MARSPHGKCQPLGIDWDGDEPEQGPSLGQRVGGVIMGTQRMGSHLALLSRPGSEQIHPLSLGACVNVLGRRVVSCTMMSVLLQWVVCIGAWSVHVSWIEATQAHEGGKPSLLHPLFLELPPLPSRVCVHVCVLMTCGVEVNNQQSCSLHCSQP